MIWLRPSQETKETLGNGQLPPFSGQNHQCFLLDWMWGIGGKGSQGWCQGLEPLKWERWSHHQLGCPLRQTIASAIRVNKEGDVTLHGWQGWRGGGSRFHWAGKQDCCHSEFKRMSPGWLQGISHAKHSREELSAQNKKCRGLEQEGNWQAQGRNATSGKESYDKPQFSSVHFSRSVVSDSLRPHESQHARPPCPSPTPGIHSDSCPSNQWCHPAISSSVIPFSSCPQSLPATESFPVSQLFAWSGQSTRVSALASSFQRNPRASRADLLQNGLVGSPCSPRDSQESSPTPQFKSIHSSALSLLPSPTLTSIHDYWKNPSLD